MKGPMESSSARRQKLLLLLVVVSNQEFSCFLTFKSGSIALDMGGGDLGHVIHVTLAVCTVCSHIHAPASTRVFGCTCSFCIARGERC